MAKIITTISIDAETSKLMKERFPRQISIITEEYWKQLLGADINIDSYENKSEIIEEINKIKESISKNKINLQVLHSKLKEEEQQEQTYINDPSFREEFFSLSLEEKEQIHRELEKLKIEGLVKKSCTPIEYYLTLRREEDKK